MEPGPHPRRPSPGRGAPRRPVPSAAAALALALASCAAPPPPAPPPTAEAASPPPPPTQPAAERAYIVFFDLGSAAIGSRGRRVVAEAARSAAAQGGRVELEAHADRSGRAGRNRRLSQRRAEAVADELARLGVPRERIAIRAHGEGSPLVPTRDGMPDPQNRGVWVVVR